MAHPVIQGYGSSHAAGRKSNEDWFVLDRHLGLYIVADGMGGRAGGEVASRLSAEVVHKFFEIAGSDSDLGFGDPDSRGGSLAEARMDMAFRQAHHEVCRRQRGVLEGMGSTLAVLLARHGRVLIAHVGDSRIYRLCSTGGLEQMTTDHSFYAEMVAAGVDDLPDRRDFRFGNLITRAVGMPGPIKPDLRSERLEGGDLYLLCSDGLSNTVEEEEIETLLRRLPVEQAPPMLVAQAISAGARDNVTAVVVKATALAPDKIHK